MSGVQQISQEALKEILSAESIKKLAAIISPKLDPNKKTLVYIIAQAVRIGHSAVETMFVNSMLGKNYDQLLIVTGTLEHLYANRSVFEVTGPNIVHVETTEQNVIKIGYLHYGLLQFDAFDFLVMSPETLYAQFSAFTRGGGKIAPFELTPRLKQLGGPWLNSLGVPDDAPIAILHARDRGYASFMTHHYFRCADVNTYHLAIDALIERGYWVFRIGDRTSPPLTHVRDQLVDVPHLQKHGDWMDIYLCGRCTFGVMQLSGPEAILRGFRKPMLLANAVPDLSREPTPLDLFMLKRFRSRAGGQDMTYQDFLRAGAPMLSMTDEFTNAGIDIIENTPEELRDAVLDMLRFLDGEPARDAEAQKNFVTMGKVFEQNIKNIPQNQLHGEAFYSLASDHTRVADSFFDHRPGFLDWKPNTPQSA